MSSSLLPTLVKSGAHHELRLGHCTWLILKGEVRAVLMEEVYFPDLELHRSEVAAINKFYPEVAHIRVPLRDWSYYVASSAMRSLRPLLGPPPSWRENV